MVFDISKVSGIGDYTVYLSKDAGNSSVAESSRASQKKYLVKNKAFLVVNKHTIEVRCDEKLKKLLVQKYESVMESRYFGRGGIEIVTEGNQLKENEIEDLVRLSYNLTKDSDSDKISE